MSELKHPNIVQLYDWGKDKGQSYIAMQYLDGLTLEDLIRTQGRLNLNLVVAIAKPVAEAAYYIHQKDLVRNDIKPSNIMLTTAGRVCLLDFGITRPKGLESEEQARFNTRMGAIVGTPPFMAPEQIQGHTADEHTDIYSLGVVLYQMLTGVFPFDGQTDYAVYRAHVEQTPTPPSQHVTLPAAIDAVILKCLEKDPDKRFQTMAELADALSAASGDLAPIDLQSVVSVAQKEAKEIEESDRKVTAYSFVPQSRVSRPVTSVGEYVPEKCEPEKPQLEPPVLEVDDSTLCYTKPHILLVTGRAEDVYGRLRASRSRYLLEKKTSVGRSSENDLVLRNTKVSRYHANFTVEGEDWFLEDFNSASGTLVNKERIITRRLLKDQDEIQIGEFVFIFNQAQ